MTIDTAEIAVETDYPDTMEPEAQNPVESEPELSAEELQANRILDLLMAKVGDVTEQDPYLKIFICGDPGGGKTTFAATAPNWLLHNVEKGAKVLRGHPHLITPGCKSIEFVSTQQVKLLVEQLKKDPRPGPLAGFETYILDSGSETQKRNMRELIAAERKISPTWPENKIPEDGWQNNTQFMNNLFSDIRDLKMHVVVTSHVKTETNKTTGRTTISPNLTPKVAEGMQGIFDLVGYYSRVEDPETGKTVRTLQVHPANGIMAKTRINGLPTVMVNPTFQELLDAYNSGQVETQDAPPAENITDELVTLDL